jgi:mannonate dehydratase
MGVSGNRDRLWSYEELRDLREAVNREGLELAAIENFDPSHWHDILLNGPQKQKQIEGIKTIIRNMGRAGIPVMGYYFSIAGVWGRHPTYGARGGASRGLQGARRARADAYPAWYRVEHDLRSRRA